jgi:hypothetical protein
MKPCKKIAHETRAGAERHMARVASINARFGRDWPGRVLRVYPCPICSTDGATIWHVGHHREEPAS